MHAIVFKSPYSCDSMFYTIWRQNHTQTWSQQNVAIKGTRLLQNALTGTPGLRAPVIRTESFGANFFLLASFGSKPKTAVLFSSNGKSPVPFCPSHKTTFARTFVCRLGAKAYGANCVFACELCLECFLQTSYRDLRINYETDRNYLIWDLVGHIN